MSERGGSGQPNDFFSGAAENTRRDLNDDMDVRHAELSKLVSESPVTAQFVTDGDRFLYVSPGFALLTGYGQTELLSLGPRHFSSDDWPRPTEHADEKSQRCSPQASISRVETRITTRDDTEKWLAVTVAPIEHAEGRAFAGTALDITEYKQREEALRRSEMRYRKVFEFAPDAIFIHDTEGRGLDGNPEAFKLLGGSSRDKAPDLLTVMESWYEEDKARFPEIRKQTMERGEYRGEFRAYKKDGQIIDIDTRVKVADIGGETVVIAITRDITRRKRMEEQIRNALQEKEMLLREIHHRVKNNMQIISTLLKLQLRNAEDDRTRALFRESQNRILSMAMIHEKLYQSEGLHKIDLNDYITDLAGEVFTSFGEDSDRIALRQDVEDISLGMDAAIPCGLMVIELLSNALKYAFPDNRRGEIFIAFQSIGHGRFELTVSDNGVGLPRDLDVTRLKSLGLRLVSDLAKYQLEGELDLQKHPGTTVRVRFHERKSR